jgi:VWFA-related protein
MLRRSFLLTSTGLFAQDSVKFSTDVKVVNVLATVRDSDGGFAKNLVQTDFQLEEDGKKQVIKYFSRQTDIPLTIGLVIDTSGSMVSYLKEERRASLRFLDQVMRPEKDQAFVIHFNRDVELLQDLTSSKKELEDALDLLTEPEVVGPGRPPEPPKLFQFPFPGGRGGRRGGGAGGGRGPQRPRFNRPGTALYDAVMLTSDEVLKKQEGRKAIILMSDGIDSGSKVSLSSAIESAQRADAVIYSICYKAISGDAGDGKKVMEKLSIQTGGTMFEAEGKKTLTQIFTAIEEELRNQYSIGYNSTQGTLGFHRIQLKVNRRGYKVKTRDGYYATSDK